MDRINVLQAYQNCYMVIPKNNDSRQLISTFNELLPEAMKRHDISDVSYNTLTYLEVFIWKLQRSTSAN